MHYYVQALDKCKEQENLIEELQGPLETLRKDAQSEFDKVRSHIEHLCLQQKGPRW